VNYNINFMSNPPFIPLEPFNERRIPQRISPSMSPRDENINLFPNNQNIGGRVSPSPPLFLYPETQQGPDTREDPFAPQKPMLQATNKVFTGQRPPPLPSFSSLVQVLNNGEKENNHN